MLSDSPLSLLHSSEFPFIFYSNHPRAGLDPLVSRIRPASHMFDIPGIQYLVLVSHHAIERVVLVKKWILVYSILTNRFFLLVFPSSLFLFPPFFLDVLLRPFLLTVSNSLKATVSMCYRDVLRSCRSVHLSSVSMSVCLISYFPPVVLYWPCFNTLSTKSMVKRFFDSSSHTVTTINSLQANSFSQSLHDTYVMV